jgi:pimeloyl-ACP methyl ester carboxylesterase
MKESAMTTYVLVHGAWHGGWCWQRVARALRARGHDVFTPSLTGLGDRVHLRRPDICLSTHIDDVTNLLRSYDLRQVVLCGHSYGGLVITGAADALPASVAALVYLDALVPEHGQSMFDLIPADYVAMLSAGVSGADGYTVPPMTAEQFAVNAADAEWMEAKCVDHPIGCFTEAITLTGAYRRVTRRTYVLADGFDHPSTKAHYTAFKDDPGWRTEVLHGGHDLMLDNPAAVAELLLAAG